MVRHKCPCCGRYGNKPILFTLTRQKIFAYIWDNPGCTITDIRRDLMRTSGDDVIRNHVSYIINVLHRKTNLRIEKKAIPRKGPGSRQQALKIIELKPPVGVTGATEGPKHGTV